MEFDEKEIAQLRKAYEELCRNRSELGSGSASGEHYKLTALLRSFGCRDKFEASAQVMNYVEHVIIYGKSPEVY